MEAITAASTQQSHPRTLRVERAITYRFSTGHTLTRWADGISFYTNTRRALNPRTDTNICARMDRLATEFDAA